MILIDAHNNPDDILTFGDESPLAVARRRKHFTLEQANRSLVLVRRIVQDIVWTHEQARILHRQLEDLISRRRRGEVQHALDLVVQRLQHLIDELDEVGCEIKDFRVGLVEFTCKHSHRLISLCWKLGEPDIRYWHEIESSPSSKRPVNELMPSVKLDA